MTLINRIFANITDKLRGNSLKAKAARGSLVLAIGTFIERGMRLVRNMILARLLAPEDFGLMAMIMAVLILLESLTDVGVRQAVIQNKESAKTEYLNIVWWFQAVRGVGLLIIASALAPAICQFYGKPELLDMMRLSFAAILFGGLTSPRLFILEKEFQFVKAALLIQGSALIGTLLTIGLAFHLRNVWALVIGYVVGGVLQCLVSFVFCPFWPKFSIDRTCLRMLLKYSRGMVGLSFLTIIALQTDVFVLGKLVSPEQLGMYSLALALAQQPGAIFSRTIGRVLLPAFAEKQDDKKALCRAVLKMIRITVVIGVPLIVLAAIFAESILSVIYGQKYAVVAIPFRLLCVTMLFSVQASIFAQVYLAIGQPHLHRRFVILLAILILSFMYPGINLFGLAGAAGVLLVANCISICMQVIWLKSAVGLRFKDYACCWWPGFYFKR